MIPASSPGPGAPRTLPPLFLALGFFMTLVQTQLARELMVSARGDEISLGIAFGAWLLSLFAGAALGSRAGRRADPQRRFTLAVPALAPLALLGVAAARATPLFTAADAPSFTYLHTLGLALLALFPFAFVAGLAFPLASDSAGRATGFYIAEAGGSMLAGLACTFFWASHGNPFSLLAAAGLPLVSLAWLAAGRLRRPPVWLPIAAATLPLLVLVPGIGAAVNAKTNGWRWQDVSGLKLEVSRATRFQYLQLGSAAGQYALYGSGQLAAVFPDRDGDFRLAAMLLAQHPRPRRALVVGDVTTGLARELLRYPLAALAAIELDPQRTSLVEEVLDRPSREALQDRRLARLHGDGRRYLQELSRQVRRGAEPGPDLLLFNLPEPSSALLNRFYTRECFQLAFQALAPDGVLALRPTTPASYTAGAQGRYGASLFHTLRGVFADVLVMPGPTALMFAARRRGLLTADADILSRRLGRWLPTGHSGLSLLFRSQWQADAVAFLNRSLKDFPRPDVNRDNRPIAYFLFNQASRQEGSGSPWQVLERAWRQRASLLLAGVLLLLLLLALPRLRPRRRAANRRLLLLAAVAGMAGMGLQLLLTFHFQTAFGQLYWAVGLAAAVFMAGMAVGAVLGGRVAVRLRPRHARTGRRALLSVQALFVFLALGQPLLGHTLAMPEWMAGAAFAIFGLLNGAFTGATFPLALSLLAGEPRRSAGRLYACDHLGGAAGSFLAPALLLPLFGMVGSSRLLAGGMAAAAILLALLPEEVWGEGNQ